MRSKSSLLSFALYDAGETILGALIFSTLYPLYITKHVDIKLYSLLYGLSFLLSFVLALWLSLRADAKAQRKLYFSLFSLFVIFCLFLLFFTYKKPVLNFALYLLLAVLHQQALVFYNSLLYAFEKRGSASGFGVAMGYIGSAFALLFLAPKLELPTAFLGVAFLFLLLSLPSMLTLKEPQERTKADFLRIISDRAFLFAFLSVLCLTEVAHTLIAMMGVYLERVYGLEKGQIYRVIGLSALGGVVGGILFGKLADRFSAKRLFPLAFLLWSAFLSLLYFSPKETIFLVGLLAGLSLAHLWTTSRVFILEEFSRGDPSVRMAFFSLSERIASSVGLLSWSAFLYLTDNNLRLSALLMSVFPLLGFLFYKLSNRRL